ncbi:MAG: GGDEF domain-containing protein [Mogibacterium sp.]|nr:GGDEF domain-containing protein [Mogibacterium sp.]
MKIKSPKNIREENCLLNKYLMWCWTALICCFLGAYTIEFVNREISLRYYSGFLFLLLVPYIGCQIMYMRNKGSYWLRYAICLGYMILYGFALFTGATTSVYAYILPIISFLVLYHDAKLMLRLGLIAIALNVIVIARDFYWGMVNEVNFYAYEIQIVLIVFCFIGAFASSALYNSICAKGEQRLQTMLEMQKEKTILEERNKYLLADALTGFGTRRAYEESLLKYKEQMPCLLSLAVLDLNNLKGVNDKYGHAEGDELITRAAEYIRRTFGSSDYGFYRIGGDEFVVIGQCSKERLDLLLKELVGAIELGETENEIKVSLATGSASTQEYTDMRVDLEEVVDAADKRMYISKQEYYKDKKNDRRGNA